MTRYQTGTGKPTKGKALNIGVEDNDEAIGTQASGQRTPATLTRNTNIIQSSQNPRAATQLERSPSPKFTKKGRGRLTRYRDDSEYDATDISL